MVEPAKSFWRFEICDQSLALHNLRLWKGKTQSLSVLQAQDPGFANGTDVYPMLGSFESTLEQVRSREFLNRPSRRGAMFLFEDRHTCERYAKAWHGGREAVIFECVPLQQIGPLHRGHLGWVPRVTCDNAVECARSYWAGLEASAPHDWEIIFHGSAYVPQWEVLPSPSLAGLGYLPHRKDPEIQNE